MSRFARAESAARRGVLMVGLGLVAYVMGGVVMIGLSARLGERLGSVTNPTLAWLLQWALLRTWMWAILPFFGWAAGRYLEISPWRFAVTAVLSGEIFGLLLATASDGLDWVLGSPADLALRVITLVGGVGLSTWAVEQGLTAAERAQALANLEADKRKAEYAEFLARAEGKKDPSPPSP